MGERQRERDVCMYINIYIYIEFRAQHNGGESHRQSIETEMETGWPIGQRKTMYMCMYGSEWRWHLGSCRSLQGLKDSLIITRLYPLV